MTVKQQLKPACAYIRVSKEKDGGYSPEQQRHEIDQYAARHGYRIVKEIPDIDMSGRTFTKRRVGEVVEDIQGGLYKTVILWKWSRWGRNVRDSLIQIAKVEQAGGKVAAATEHFDERTSIGKFSRDQMLLIAELQSNQIGDGWKETQARRLRAGLTHAGGPRFGYTYVPGTKDVAAHYAVSEPEASLLADAYRRYADGMATLRGLAMEWNAKGIHTTQGRAWSNASVRTVMDTGFAAGLIRERSQKPSEGHFNSRTLDAFDIWHKGAQPAIIDMETWETYVALRRAFAKVPARLRAPNHAFSGLVFCACCGARMVACYTGKLRHRSWRCRRGAEVVLHSPVGVSDKRLMKVIQDWFEQNALGGGSVERDAVQLAQRNRPVIDEDRPAKNLKQLRDKLSKLVDGWLAGRVDDSNYDLQRDRLDGQIKEAQAKIDEVSAAVRKVRVAPTIQQFRGLATEWPRWSGANQNAALAAVVDGLVVFPGGDVLVVSD